MIKSTVEKLAPEIGFEIGASDDVTQSNLLKGFFKGLNNSILDKHKLEMQMCFICDKLDNNSKELILILADFIKNEK